MSYIQNSDITLGELCYKGKIELENDDFNCVICSNVLYDNYQCSLGHTSCKNCWLKILSDKKECHTCRLKINSFKELSKNLYLEKEILKQKVKCLNNGTESNSNGGYSIFKSDGGCKRTDIPIGDLVHHMKNECGYLLVSCKTNGFCKYYKHTSNDIHNSECEYFEVYCPANCGNKLKRNDLKYHLGTQNCIQSNKNDGGSGSGSANKIILNLEEENKNLEKKIAQLKNEIKESKTIQKERNKDMDKKLKDSQDTVKDLEFKFKELEEKFNYLLLANEMILDGITNRSGTILIRNWKQRCNNMKNGEAIIEQFKVGLDSFKWFIYPNGLEHDDQGYLSIYLGREDNSKRLDVSVKVSIGDIYDKLRGSFTGPHMLGFYRFADSNDIYYYNTLAIEYTVDLFKKQ